MDNSVTLSGNATRDPELRYTNAGQTIVSFGLAVNRRFQAKGSSDWQETTSFFDVVAFGTLAENAGASFHKGDRVIVAGRLEQRSYETKSGEKRTTVELIADDLGASAKWCTVASTKAERTESRPAAKPPSYSADEEPF